VTAEPLRVAGFEPLVPDRARLGALVRMIVMHLGDASASVPTTAGDLRVRATAATLNHEALSLSPGGLAILRELAREPGRVRSREQLLAVMPGESDDPHAAEVAVARLRDVVGRDVVRTVVKRGYALALAEAAS
jgi:uroporphyrinogen-III synthase